MPDPTLSGLAGQLATIADQLATIATGTTTPPTVAPQAPTGLRSTLLADGRRQLDWDLAVDAAQWEVRDESNTVDPVKEVVAVPRSVRSAVKRGSVDRRYVIVAVGPTGLRSAPSAALVVTAGGAPAPTPAPLPGSGVDLSRWKLTLPVLNDAGKITEIRPPALATHSDQFWTPLPGGGYRCRVWHGGDTTSGSSNPRSELRERVGDDPEGYWNAGRGRHVMEWSGQVNRLTRVKPHVVIGQVHDRGDDVVVWRVEGDKLWLTRGDDPHGFLVDEAFTLGKPYTCRYQIVDGEYGFAYNGRPLPYTLRSTAESYFKVGLYLQSNPTSAPGESPEEYAEVIVTSVTVAHS